MLRRCIHKLGAVLYRKRTSRRKKQLENASMSVDFSSIQRDLYVNIILAGGLVELYHGPITAGRIMERYPGMTVARPDIFKRPNESLVRPDEELLPREKFFLVPTTTVRKLRSTHQLSEEREFSSELKEVKRLEWNKAVVVESGGREGNENEEQREFFVLNKKYRSDLALKQCCREESGVEKRGFNPPIKKAKSWRKLDWQPGLDSIEEVSP